ncbi:MAG TPA: decaprenyl-phosphate phosphoribosyltransferase [Ktedonobacterales bacterium]
MRSITENQRAVPESEPGSEPGGSNPVARRLQFWYLLKAIRLRQWTKNLLVFAGVVFAQRVLDVGALGRATAAFVVFCLLSSLVYLVNDLGDLESDRRHPTKRYRPLASGKLSAPVAVAGAVLLGVLATALTIALLLWPGAAGSGQSLHVTLAPLRLTLVPGTPLSPDSQYGILGNLGGSGFLFALVAAAYVGLNLAYTFRLKHVVIVDVFCIAGGFVLRAMAGAVVIPVPISPWLYLCTILLSLFLALGKRRQELMLLDAGASLHRRILQEYNPQLLDQMISIVISATVMAYSLYTFQGTAGNHRLMVTIPFVLYGIFRYLYLIYMKQEGGSPEEVLLRDKHILGSVALCVLTTLALLYLSF